MRVLWATALLFFLAACTAPLALGEEALPVSSSAPDFNTSPVFAQNTVSVPVDVGLSPGVQAIRTIWGEISTQNVQGQDGSLADDYRVKLFWLNQRDSDPLAYTGYMGLSGLAPGTYYLQLNATIVDFYISPVYTIRIQAPAPPAPPVAAAPAPPATSAAPVRVSRKRHPVACARYVSLLKRNTTLVLRAKEAVRSAKAAAQRRKASTRLTRLTATRARLVNLRFDACYVIWVNK